MPAHVTEGGVRLRFDAGDPAVTGVGLDCDPAVPGPRAFERRDDGWVLDLPAPGLDRVEYRFAVRRGAGVDVVLDPGNPLTVRTAFGDRSVLELPGYAPPWWLDADTPAGRFDPMTVAGETADDVPVTVWSPDGLADDEPAPLLVVHDGPEYDDLARITRCAAAHVAAGTLPPHRLALAHPVLRDAWYSGSPQYLRTLATAGLDRLAERHPVRAPVVVMGASLGGLTALLLGLAAAPRVGGVFAQSGSFFQVRHDDAESGYRYFGRISRTVQSVLDARHTDHPLVVGMTCGALEENAANNRDMAAALRRAGHDVRHREVADLHNYTAWRDALDPGLVEVLRAVWDRE
ncbi:alpha/beta hydrolase-fold protein [Phycicoccus flavus]|uniref:alpha/beta hydrolase-fold protein n=1 Tax=Phycicoccus flavus TaxID=2502783 RepID=UPI000FEBE331|nr:alpha/beta hydrolase-fold protein [Phycicoccus flavus]NHA68026.1 esterase [Phycicoccus flavus]